MFIAIDTETELIRPGVLAPRLVCMSYSDGEITDLVDHKDTPELFRSFAEAGATFVLHNAPYDLAVIIEHDPTLLPLVIQLLDDERVHDTKVIEALLHIRRGTLKMARRRKGSFSLAALSEKYTGIPLAKGEDTWRLRYGELRDVPLEDWPEDALSYAKGDGLATWKVFDAMPWSEIKSEALQNCAAMALHAMSCWGVRTDPDSVDDAEIALLEQCIDLRDKLIESGFVRPDGSRNTKLLRAWIDEKFEGRAPRTRPSKRFPEGQIKIDDDTLALFESDEKIKTLRDYKKSTKLLSDFLPKVRRGTACPINARFNVLVETGRTSCADPNLQQLPRKGGMRECFVPRPGYLLVTCDWAAVELRALAQVCYSWFGFSKLREAFIEGLDPHLIVAAQLLGISYEVAQERLEAGDEEVVDTRQFSKIGNFGFAGGMGAASFVDYARGYGVELSLTLSETIKAAWKAAWPEHAPYFETMASITGDMGSHQLEQYGSGRVRGDLSFCQAANTMFQGLVADAAKHSLWEVFKACYLDEASPLYGTRPIVFAHDEIIAESPEDKAADAGDELSRLMNETASLWMPDVPIVSEPALMRRWYKGAKPVRGPNGKLIPWEPSR